MEFLTVFFMEKIKFVKNVKKIIFCRLLNVRQFLKNKNFVNYTKMIMFVNSVRLVIMSLMESVKFHLQLIV